LESRRLVSLDRGPLSLTSDGLATKRAIEAATDAHADRAIDTVGVQRVIELREAMRPWITLIMEADVIGAWKMREALWRDE
jgi:hypothetical protein